MSCSVEGLITDIRKALNECNVDSDMVSDGCGCNARYTDVDILFAINLAVRQVVSIRPDLFMDSKTMTIPAGSCEVDVCVEGCDKFLEVSYSTVEPCYTPTRKAQDKIGKLTYQTNPCLEYKNEALDESTVVSFYHNPKKPCYVTVYRVATDEPTEIVIKCSVFPDLLSLGSDFPEIICERYMLVVYHYAMFHLFDRDHSVGPEMLQISQIHRDTASILMGDTNQADGDFYSKRFMGQEFNVDD